MIALRLRFWLVAAGVACAAHVHAAPSWILPKDSTVQELAVNARIYGAPADMLSYKTPLAVPALIAFMARQYPGLRDMSVYPGVAILSDTSGPCPRVVTVSGQRAGGSGGILSTICWQQAMSKPAFPAAWLPAGSELVFEFSGAEGLGGAVQQIWRHTASPDDIAAQVHSNLARLGWQSVSRASGTAVSWQTWRRGEESMAIDILGKQSGSLLAVLRFASLSSAAPGMSASGDTP